MRFTSASLSLLALAGASILPSNARAAVVATPAVDLSVLPATNAPITLRTFPNAHCLLDVAGTRSKMTVFADDNGMLALHVTPAAGGAATAAFTARCDAHGSVMTRIVRLHVDARAPRPLAMRPASGARPLLPQGVSPGALSEADLKRLQLPPRPDAVRDPKNYALWLRAMTTPVTRIKGNTILRPDVVHGPMRFSGMRRRSAAAKTKNGYFTSGNWSGIVDNGGTNQYSYWVAGQWIVPAVSTVFGESPAYSSVWDGIDGWNSSDVIQNGTEQDADYLPLFGSLSFYSAWYEFFPDGGSTTLPNFNVNPGDQIYAVSWVCYDSYGQRYGCYYMENLTQGEATPVYSELGQKPALFQGNSAEWITERPTVNGALGPLPQFGLFPFWWEHVYDSYSAVGRNACDGNENIASMFNRNDELASGFTTACDSSDFYWTNFQ